MTLQTAEKPGARRLLVKQKWRPSLAMIVFAVLTTATALPLAGLFFFRLYENQLIRQTEAELVAQSAVVAALFEREVDDTLAKSSTNDAVARRERRFMPIEPSLDLAPDHVSRVVEYLASDRAADVNGHVVFAASNAVREYVTWRRSDTDLVDRLQRELGLR